MKPLKRAALAVALTPAALLAAVFAERLWVTAIRPEVQSVVRARRRERQIRRQLRAARVLGAQGVTILGSWRTEVRPCPECERLRAQR